MPHGFLVVVSHPSETRPETRSCGRYLGVNRIPEYPANDEDEAAAMDEYVFGEYKCEETNLIPSFRKAMQLFRLFSRSKRDFEIIFCRYGSDNQENESVSEKREQRPYGFDVAGVRGDYWSIVDDFSRSSWATRYRSQLNEFGLFDDEKVAREYLVNYKRNCEPDADSPFEVVFVAGCTSHAEGN